MTSLNRPSRLNRGLLAIVGVTLVAGGGLAMAAGIGMLPVDPASTLAPGTALPPTWALYAVTAVTVLLAVLCLCWLGAQLARKPKTHTWHVEDDGEHGRTELATRIAATPFAADVAAYPGIRTAHADLTGHQDSPTLAVIVTTEQGADLSDIRHRLDTHGLPRLRTALDLPALPTTLEFRFTTKSGARTV